MYLVFTIVTFALQINSFYLLTIAYRVNIIHGIGSVGGGQSNPVKPGFTTPFTVFGRAVIGCLSRNSIIICTAFKAQRLQIHLQQTRLRFHYGSVISRLLS